MDIAKEIKKNLIAKNNILLSLRQEEAFIELNNSDMLQITKRFLQNKLPNEKEIMNKINHKYACIKNYRDFCKSYS